MSCAPHPARPSSASTPHSESDSRSNAFRIKRSRTPVQLPKFDVQPFQRVTNSRLFPCDRSPLVSGDYKLRGRGRYPCSKAKIPNSEQKCRPVSHLLSSVCASPLLASILFSVVCENMRGEGGDIYLQRLNLWRPPFALCFFPSDRVSSFQFRISFFLPTAIMEFETPAGRSY